MPNCEELKRVLKWIQTNPEEWDQTDWFTRSSNTICGTAGCFAGNALLLNGYEAIYGVGDRTSAHALDIDGNVVNVADKAEEILGLSFVESELLFDAANTMEDLERIVDELCCKECQDAD